MILAGFGIAVLVTALMDVTTSAVSLRGGGVVTLRLTNMLWRAAVRRRPRHGLLQVYGSLMLPLTIVVWTGLLIGGWSLVFLSDPGAVERTSSGESASIGERIYFAGYSVSTLGNGELRPGGPLWQACTVAAALSGLALITLAITFITPVLGAATNKRRAAASISGLGDSTESILRAGWNGRDFDALATELNALAPVLSQLGQQHVAYPVLHYLHTPDRAVALAPQVKVLDDVVTLVAHGVAPDKRPAGFALRTVTHAMDTLLGAVDAAHLDTGPRTISPPRLDTLDRLGVPAVDPGDYRRSAAMDDGRRSLVAALVTSDGWDCDGDRGRATD